jgi:hypothetical protein
MGIKKEIKTTPHYLMRGFVYQRIAERIKAVFRGIKKPPVAILGVFSLK